MAFVGQLATWSVFLLLAWISVRLFWRITLTTVPAPVVAIETQPLRLAEKLKGVQWFGVSPSPQMQIQAAPNFSLRGLIGTSGSRALGMAIFVIDNKSQKVVREGEEISPGCVLDKVTPDGVQIQRNGIREFLPIPKRAG